MACIDCLHELRWWESEARARAIRAVVAAQWGVALRSMAHRYPVLSREVADEGLQVMCENIRELASLPTAEQIVDGTA